MTQDASAFPMSANETTTLSIGSIGPGAAVAGSKWSIALRVPWWATSSNNVSINNIPVPNPNNQIVAGTYLILGPREWKSGDKVGVYFPLSLRFEQLDDDRPAFAGFGTIHYGPLLLAGLTSEDSLLLDNASDAAVQRTVRRTGAVGDALSFVATPDGDCTTAANITLIPFNDVRNRHASAVYTTYFHTHAKHYDKATAVSTKSLLLAAADDFALQGGASVSPTSAASSRNTKGDAGHHHTHSHYTHRALADPLYSRSAGTVGDYDPSTGSHYKLPDPQQSNGPLLLNSGAPHTNSSAMMAAPFVGSAVLEAVSFSFRYTVGVPAQPPKNVSCAAGTQLAGGSVHVANFSSVTDAISWCRADPKCAGFCARTPICPAPGAYERDDAMIEYEFKDAWGVAHHSASPGATCI